MFLSAFARFYLLLYKRFCRLLSAGYFARFYYLCYYQSFASTFAGSILSFALLSFWSEDFALIRVMVSRLRFFGLSLKVRQPEVPGCEGLQDSPAAHWHPFAILRAENRIVVDGCPLLRSRPHPPLSLLPFPFHSAAMLLVAYPDSPAVPFAVFPPLSPPFSPPPFPLYSAAMLLVAFPDPPAVFPAFFPAAFPATFPAVFPASFRRHAPCCVPRPTCRSPCRSPCRFPCCFSRRFPAIFLLHSAAMPLFAYPYLPAVPFAVSPPLSPLHSLSHLSLLLPSPRRRSAPCGRQTIRKAAATLRCSGLVVAPEIKCPGTFPACGGGGRRHARNAMQCPSLCR